MHRKNTPTSAYPALSQSPHVVYVNEGRRSPRIAQGVLVLLISGIAGLIIFAMGQSAWGAIWRGWLVTAILVAIAMVVL